MKPGDFVSIPYYHYTAYGYIESISDYGLTKVIMAYKYNRDIEWVRELHKRGVEA